MKKMNQINFVFCHWSLEPFILWSYDIWSWYVHSESRKIDATKNKENMMGSSLGPHAIFVSLFPFFLEPQICIIRKLKSNYFEEIHHNKSLKNFFGMLFNLGSGILDVLKEFRLLEHTATHYLLTRDFIIGKKAHDCKLTMPLLLLLCLLPKSLYISRAARYL